MARHHIERCSCGRRLAKIVEYDTGMCLSCLEMEGGVERFYEDHEHCNPEVAEVHIDKAMNEYKERGL